VGLRCPFLVWRMVALTSPTLYICFSDPTFAWSFISFVPETRVFHTLSLEQIALRDRSIPCWSRFFPQHLLIFGFFGVYGCFQRTFLLLFITSFLRAEQSRWSPDNYRQIGPSLTGRGGSSVGFVVAPLYQCVSAEFWFLQNWLFVKWLEATFFFFFSFFFFFFSLRR